MHPQTSPSFDRTVMRAVLTVTLSTTAACFNPGAKSSSDTGTEGSSSGTSTTDGSSSGSSATDTSTTHDGSSSSSGAADSSSGGDDTSSSSTTAQTDSGSSSSGEPVAICGDGVLDRATEQCDDANDVAGDLCDAACHFESLTFSFTGASESFEVPAWVDELRIEAWGAQGGGARCCDDTHQDDGGLGGYVAATLPALAGETLTIAVGGQGTSEGAGGFNGGGNGGLYAAGGGGASDVRIGDALLARLAVAAGGGGGNCGCPDHGAGGAGGGLDGDPGLSYGGYTVATGGTQNAGGSPGEVATAGDLGVGGGPLSDSYHIAGGGGGYYGGGAAYAAGGGGGSSYYGAALDASTTAGLRAGDGELVITPLSAL